MGDVLKDIDVWWAQEGPDAPEEWDFDSVPDSEIIACCLWEWARESKTIHLRADLHWCRVRNIRHREDYKENPSLKAEHDAEAKIIVARAKRERFKYGAFFDQLWRTDFPAIEIYNSVLDLMRDAAMPWQRLPTEARANLSGQVGKSSLIRPLGIATVGELEELWKANSIDLNAVRRQKRCADNDTEDGVLWEQTVLAEPFATEEGALRGRFAAAFAIDFSRFTDLEISKTFVDWLAENRPKRWKQPRRDFPGARQRGRKLIEYRVALERLGLMRLLHWHTPQELRDEMAVAWRMISPKEGSFRREIREASRFFRKLFPFLPKGERPFSEERNGTWSPPIQRMLDQMDADRANRGDIK